MPLYLTGGADQQFFRNLDQKFMSQIESGTKMLVVPLASDPEEFDDIYERLAETFTSRKIVSIDLCERVDQYSYNDILDYNVIYLEGGNTFQLIQHVRQCNFFNHLKKYLQEGRHIYADSAGAIVLGSSVTTAFIGEEADEDFERLQNYRGLDLLGNWTVHCHYHKDEKDAVQSLVFEEGAPILALRERCAIYVNDSLLTIYGTTPLDIYTFTDQHTFPPGAEVNLNSLL